MTNVMTLGEVATYINGRAFKPSEWEETGLPIIRIQNLTESNKKYNYSSKTFDEKFRIKNDDLLFAWSASLGAFIWKGGDAWLNQHIFKVEPKPFIQKRYLYYFLLYVIADLYAKTHGSGMVHITKGPFMSTPIQVPSRPEQKRIVEKIDELFSDLDAAEAELLISQKKLDIYRTSLLTLASEGFPLTEKNSTLSSWKRVKIENILSDSDKGMTTGPFGTMLPKKDHRKVGIPVLGIENIGNGIFVDGNKIFIDIEKARELKSFQVAPDDIIISRSGTVGKLCVVPSYVGEAYLSTNLIRIKLNKKKIIPQFFVYFFLSKGIVWEQIKELCKGSTRPFLNQTILKSIDFPLPSLDDQRRILNIIESKFSICDVLQKQIAESIIKSKALRQGILKQAFEGGLV